MTNPIEVTEAVARICKNAVLDKIPVPTQGGISYLYIDDLRAILAMQQASPDVGTVEAALVGAREVREVIQQLRIVAFALELAPEYQGEFDRIQRAIAILDSLGDAKA